MIDVRFEALKGEVLILDMKGHAGFAELGKDPVCAGASVLAMTVSVCTETMHREGKLKKAPTMRVKNGRVLVVCKPKPEYWTEALHLFYVAETGMHLLAESYPEHVALTPFATPEEG